MSFRNRARQKLQERAQAQAGDGDEPDAGQSEQTDPAASEPVASPAQADYTAELKQLAQLKDQGILTEEEFTAKKGQILGI